MAPSAGLTAYALHHTTLPPRLPGTDDYDVLHETQLLNLVIEVLQSMESDLGPQHAEILDFAAHAIDNLRHSRDDKGHVGPKKSLDLLGELVQSSAGTIVPLHIGKQNAGVIITRGKDCVVFEAFELSPKNIAAMSTGRLKREFPSGYGVQIPIEKMQKDLLQQLSSTLSNMSKNEALDFQQEKSLHDTAHPGLVTDFFLRTISAVGEIIDITCITKHTREDRVSKDKNQPWRRSPLWLLVRVTLQLIFHRDASTSNSKCDLYKSFMILFQARILELVQTYAEDLGCELMHAVSSKIVRRLRKLETRSPDSFYKTPWTNRVEASLKRAHDFVALHWQRAQRTMLPKIDPDGLGRLRPNEDLQARMPNLYEYLAGRTSEITQSRSAFFNPSSRNYSFLGTDLPTEFGMFDEFTNLRLAAVESWVDEHLHSWAREHHGDPSICGNLLKLMREYFTTASTTYANIPIGYSVMILTTLDVWKTCDEIACLEIPLLKEYGHEIFPEHLQHLKLPRRSQMERFRDIEQYLKTRQNVANTSHPSVYRDFGHRDSFAVKYYDQSSALQTLMSEIERDAASKKSETIKKLADLMSKYSDLMEQYSVADCEFEMRIIKVKGIEEERRRHATKCSRCAIKKRANQLKIAVHEWPMPKDRSIAAAVVFELKIPVIFSDWRDASMFLLVDVLNYRHEAPIQPHEPGEERKFTLKSHHALSHMLAASYSDRRVIISSETPPRTPTLKKVANVQSQEDVCLANRLKYAYYDKTQRIYIVEIKPSENTALCTLYKMPRRSKSLESFLLRSPTHPDGISTNEPIATLYNCPPHFSVEEYKAFGITALGHHTTYANLLAQLAMPSIDFAKSETLLMIMQSLYELGPSNNDRVERESHEMLRVDKFCEALLHHLRVALKDRCGNWESWKASAAFSIIIRRILSLTTSKAIAECCLKLLCNIQEICLEWLERLRQRMSGSSIEEQRNELDIKAIEIALLAINTFDIEDMYLDDILTEHSSMATLFQCCVLVQQSKEVLSLDPEGLRENMLQSTALLNHRLFPKIRHIVLNDPRGLNLAVSTNWAGFQISDHPTWQLLHGSGGDWLYHASTAYSVHFNLITAELLVNGVPLARLPTDFANHTTYLSLFGNFSLEVVPSTEPNMTFASKLPFQGYKIHLGREGDDLLVLVINGETKLDLLPCRLFEEILPDAFATQYVHWYDRTTGKIILCDKSSPWPTDTETWGLIPNESGNEWRLSNGREILISMTSDSARILSNMFQSVEDEQHIHILLDVHSQAINVAIPRLQLTFYVDQAEGRVYSRQYRDMMLDNNQDVGTLIGLSSKIVLRHKEDDRNRVILIPRPRMSVTQPLSFTKRSSGFEHIDVTINKNAADGVFVYSIDDTLRVIKLDGTLSSRLLLSYLHALTSSYLPDPLTNCTGMESCLMILRSAAVRSFDSLSLEAIALLTQIGNLSTTMTYRQTTNPTMQQIIWDSNLYASSQHPQIRTAVHEMLDQARRMTFFFPHGTAVPQADAMGWRTTGKCTQSDMKAGNSPPKDAQLELRHAIRTSTFHVDGFGAEHFTATHDVIYESRDREPETERGRRAYQAATMIIREENALHMACPDLSSRLLQTYFDKGIVKGKLASYDAKFLHYDARWLKDYAFTLREDFCSLYACLGKKSKNLNDYAIMMWLSLMAYAEGADMISIQTLATFYRMEDVTGFNLPDESIFDLSQGNKWNPEEVNSIVRRFALSLADCPQCRIPQDEKETDEQHKRRIYSLYVQAQSVAISKFIAHLKTRWTKQEIPSPTSAEICPYFDMTRVMETLRDTFKSWNANHRFLNWLSRVSRAMRGKNIPIIPIATPCHSVLPPVDDKKYENEVRHHSITAIFLNTALDLPNDDSLFIAEHELPFNLARPEMPTIAVEESPSRIGKIDVRQKICRQLDWMAKSAFEKKLIKDLRDSCTALKIHMNTIKQRKVKMDGSIPTLLEQYARACRHHLENFTATLAQVVLDKDRLSHRISAHTHHYPRISPKFWLGQLHIDCFESLSQPWKSIVIAYGLAVTELQRALRLVSLAGNPSELAEELQNVGHKNWSPSDFPETLLLEAESNIMVREIQETIAHHMRSPPQPTTNTVMQLNMGEGKTSVIIPMVATALSNRQSLVRILVAKPQHSQMLQTLTAKLGGLLNRRIYHMPFTRALKLTTQQARVILEMCEECLSGRGILLIQPEHILSLQLMGLEYCINSTDGASAVLALHRYFYEHSRDVVDESDEQFNNSELIYTMGSQKPIELSPRRWLIIQEILALVAKYCHIVKVEASRYIEIQGGDGVFPRVRILHREGANRLVALLAKHVIEHGVTGLSTRNETPKMQAALITYITHPDLDIKEISEIESSPYWSEYTKDILLLIRGIFASGILRFVLSSKRYRVNYGLDHHRHPPTSLAVPYRYKDGPSRSEYSHPDVLICLTLLSYYYNGLEDEQMFDSFKHLLKSDQAALEYEEWIRTASSSLPATATTLSGVNLRDQALCIEQIFPFLRYSKNCIDFYLSRLVFPKEVKQFDRKISSSGWDLGRAKLHPLTGFSGTTDAQHLLPLTVHALDLDSQKHTNALVLSNILSASTWHQLLPRSEAGSDADYIIQAVLQMSDEVRVILDCGAQILEQSNMEVATLWLRLCTNTHVQAAVYFDHEELSVIDRNGRTESLQSSPYSNQLDQTVVYLDEAHTRGTDLKLPRDYKAAVTLGAGLTKDRLTQACMRMRKLGQGQTVAFLVPEEILTKILVATCKPEDEDIDVEDILCWSFSETWQSLKKNMPQWAAQGARAISHEHLHIGPELTQEDAMTFLEDESQTIEKRFRPKPRDRKNMAQFEGWDQDNKSIKLIIERCINCNAMGFSNLDLEEEEERELAPEKVDERQVERPQNMVAAQSSTHPDVIGLVQSGTLRTRSKGVFPAFQALHSLSIGDEYLLSQFPTDLLVTTEFMNTVDRGDKTKEKMIMDSYQRPVQWIISIPKTNGDDIKNFLIISPHEANVLMKDITKYAKVTLHLFAPRTNINYAPLDSLQLLNFGRTFKPESVSRSLIMQLNLFAGSLYLRSFQEYTELCDMLGLLRENAKEGQIVLPDGFITTSKGTWKLRDSPVSFLRELLTKIRREGEGLEKTHLGKILNGVRLEEADFRVDTEMTG